MIISHYWGNVDIVTNCPTIWWVITSPTLTVWHQTSIRVLTVCPIFYFMAHFLISKPLWFPEKVSAHTLCDSLPERVRSYWVQDSYLFLWRNQDDVMSQWPQERYEMYFTNQNDINYYCKNVLLPVTWRAVTAVCCEMLLWKWWKASFLISFKFRSPAAPWALCFYAGHAPLPLMWCMLQLPHLILYFAWLHSASSTTSSNLWTSNDSAGVP